LSYIAPYPYYFRTCTSEAAQSIALADIIYNYYGWRHVSIFSTADSYGNDLAYVFQGEAAKYGLHVLSASSFQPGKRDLTNVITTALDTGSSIFVLFMGVNDAKRLLTQGYTLGLFRQGTQIFGSGLMTDPATWAGMTPEVMTVMNGYLGLLPYNVYDNSLAKGFVRRFRQMKDTATTNSDGSITCDPSLDGNHVPIWGSNTTGCIDMKFSEYDESGADIAFYAPYAYDATYAIARSLHTYLYTAGYSKIDGDSLGNYVTNVSFQGVTGSVSFRLGDPTTGYGYGDRLHDFRFRILNFRQLAGLDTGAAAADYSGEVAPGTAPSPQLVPVGVWWEAGAGFVPCKENYCEIVFNTADGAAPRDKPFPTVDEMVGGMTGVLWALSILCLLYLLFLTAFMLKYRRTRLLKVAQPEMLSLVIAGSFLGSFRALVAVFGFS
jgi:hypothetical protein